MLSKFSFYIILLLHFFYYRRSNILKKIICGENYNKWIEQRASNYPLGLIFREYHSISVLCSFLFVIYFKEIKILHYSIGSVLVFILWDGGFVYLGDDIINNSLISLHHIGSVLALIDIPNISDERAWHNAYLFSWLWSIHSFKEFQGLIMYIFNMKIEAGKENEPIPIFNTIRHIHGFISVYFFYLLICSENQPVLFQNKQALYSICMIIGRFFACCNFLRIPHFRTTESPGFFLVIMFHLLSTGQAMVAYLFAFCVSSIFIGIDIYKTSFADNKIE